MNDGVEKVRDKSIPLTYALQLFGHAFPQVNQSGSVVKNSVELSKNEIITNNKDSYNKYINVIEHKYLLDRSDHSVKVNKTWNHTSTNLSKGNNNKIIDNSKVIINLTTAKPVLKNVVLKNSSITFIDQRQVIVQKESRALKFLELLLNS